MMNLEKQVNSLELSKRLRELGVKRESLFHWVTFKNTSSPEGQKEREHRAIIGEWEKEFYTEKSYLKDFKYYSAFTAAELGEILPYKLKNDSPGKNDLSLEILKYGNNRWLLVYVEDQNKPPIICIIDKSEANARAKMCIYLIENGLVKVENL